VSDSTEQSHQPLAGIKVVEIGTSVAAPFGTWILAALGAEVVKVERPEGGDDARAWGNQFPDGRGSYFESLNRDKRGITVNLRDESERKWLRDYCVEHADVVLQNLRAGKVESMGLGAADMIAGDPSMIYCNLRAFGADGPLKDLPGYDPLMQAFGGLMSVTGEEGRPAVRVGTSLIDMGTGMWCVIGIISALFQRTKNGRGCVLDASLYETSLAWMTMHTASAQAGGMSPKRGGSGMAGIAPYQAYLCGDGELIIAAPNDRLFAKLATALDSEHWCQDERFIDNRSRVANLTELNAELEAILSTQAREHWQSALEAVGVPSAPVRTTLEMMGEPQTAALGMLQTLPGSGPALMGMPVRFDGVRPPLRRAAPLLGEHDDEVRGES
jgi:crotonobetainyl-CoA:carnitine CoA-transferase CaiB-like acyl-CoA transferase